MQKIKRVEGFLNKRKKGQGPLGKTALSSPSSRPKQGRGEQGHRGIDPGAPGHGGAWGEGEKREGATGIRFPVLPRAGTARGGGATRAGGGGRRWSRRRRCKARKGCAGAGRVRGGAEARGGRIYSRGMVVARRWRGGAASVAVRRVRRGALMAFGQLLVSRHGVRRWRGRRGRRRARG